MISHFSPEWWSSNSCLIRSVSCIRQNRSVFHLPSWEPAGNHCALTHVVTVIYAMGTTICLYRWIHLKNVWSLVWCPSRLLTGTCFVFVIYYTARGYSQIILCRISSIRLLTDLPRIQAIDFIVNGSCFWCSTTLHFWCQYVDDYNNYLQLNEDKTGLMILSYTFPHWRLSLRQAKRLAVWGLCLIRLLAWERM